MIKTLTEPFSLLKAEYKFKKMTTVTTIIDAVFLLDKELKDSLISIIKDLQTKHPELNFVLSGLWPPYNFVEITLK